jgi:hypothetical protein
MQVSCACIFRITSVHRTSHKAIEAASQRKLCLFELGLTNLLCAAGIFNMPWSAGGRCGIQNRERRTYKCTFIQFILMSLPVYCSTYHMQ